MTESTASAELEPLKYPVGVFALICRKSGPKLEILLLRRNDLDVWNLPGGGIDDLEDTYEGLKREVREETGLEVAPEFTEAFIFDGPRDKENPIGAETREDYFGGIYCTIQGGELTLTDESSGAGWFPVDELPPDTYERHAILIDCINRFDESKNYAHEISERHAFIPEGIE
jgi:8-oxo-dGTP diphosphatase